MDLVISVFSSGPWVLLSPFVLAGSIILLRRFGGWSPLLQVIGSAAYIVLHLYEFTVIWLQAPGRLGTHSIPFHLWTQHWWVQDITICLRLLVICFPIGFLWFAIRAVRRI
jgi:hypothetical protein